MSNCITECNLNSGNVGCNVSDSQYENTCKPNNLGNNKNQGPDLVSISAHQMDVNYVSVKGRLDVNGASFDGDNLFGLSYMDPLTVDSNNICVDDTLVAKHIITDNQSSLYECTHGLKTKVIGFNSCSTSCNPEFNLNASKQIQFTSNIKLSNFYLEKNQAVLWRSQSAPFWQEIITQTTFRL